MKLWIIPGSSAQPRSALVFVCMRPKYTTDVSRAGSSACSKTVRLRSEVNNSE